MDSLTIKKLIIIVKDNALKNLKTFCEGIHGSAVSHSNTVKASVFWLLRDMYIYNKLIGGFGFFWGGYGGGGGEWGVITTSFKRDHRFDLN